MARFVAKFSGTSGCVYREAIGLADFSQGRREKLAAALCSAFDADKRLSARWEKSIRWRRSGRRRAGDGFDQMIEHI